MMAALDWLPTLTELAGGQTGDGLKKQIESGSYPGFVKTTLDGVNQAALLTGKSDKSARDYLFYYPGEPSVDGLEELSCSTVFGLVGDATWSGRETSLTTIAKT
jgi:hypothetical protein